MAPFADCKPPPSAMDDTKPSIDDPNPSIGNIKQEEMEAPWPEVMTFTPTMEEFCDLTKLLTYMESKGAHKAGIAKIKPPKEWVARARGYQPSQIDIEIQAPIEQTLAPTDVVGAFQANNKNLPKLKVEDYRKLATRRNYVTPAHQSYEELEELYWEAMINDTVDPPIYGADVCDSVTDPEQKIWNINRLESSLTEVMEEQIPGVNMPYLYFGMWRATFSWHVEDMDLYGVNFLHYGAPKTWYCVPPQYGYKLEAIAEKIFPNMSKACFNLFRHKAVMLSPALLEEFGLRVHKVVQEDRDMIIVFPHAYHSGFNHGFNIAESTNFAIPRWVEYGKRFRGCLCGDRAKEVDVNMEPFIQRYQPDRLQDWRNGVFELHPEDPQFIKDAYRDAKLRLNPAQLKRFRNHLKERREIPPWFLKIEEEERMNSEVKEEPEEAQKERKVDEIYKDNVDLFKNYDLSDFVEDWTMASARKWSPKHRAALRRLRENLDTCTIRLKSMRPVEAMSYLQKRRRQEKYERLQKSIAEANTLDNYSHYANGHVSGGFKGANIADMMEKKAQRNCIKNHRFRACKKCFGCRTPNCGQCISCCDMPRFGGLGVNKQKCLKRVCTNPVMQSCESCKWNADAL